jgi:hypothetical protein
MSPRKLILIAGKPSHPPRMHEYRAGMLLLQQCLADRDDINVEVHTGGWVEDEATLDDADAVVFFADGRAAHPFADADQRRRLEPLLERGLGLGCLHYAVELSPQPAVRRFTKWLGGTYEFGYSYNPFWEATFDSFPEHQITRGVEPFELRDEWYFNIRFDEDLTAGDSAALTPILVARPSDLVRNSPGGDSRTPYEHIVADAGRAETLLWAVERPDGGRGFGFTGAHFHDNWGNDDFRKLILNALLWVAKVNVPESGVDSALSPGDLDINLDSKDGIPVCSGCGCLVEPVA